MSARRGAIGLLLLLTLVVAAETVRIDGIEVSYRLVEGRQLVSRDELAQVFPGVEPGEGWVDLADLTDHPNARVMRRDGLITSVRFYDGAQNRLLHLFRKQDGQQAEAPPSNAAGTDQALVDDIVALSNQARAQNGAGPLASHPALEQAAREHSEEMLRLGYMAHKSPTAGRENVQKRVQLAGVDPLGVGENLARFKGYPANEVAAATVQGWMESPGHRRNLLDPDFTRVGIGIANRDGEYLITQVLSSDLP